VTHAVEPHRLWPCLGVVGRDVRWDLLHDRRCSHSRPLAQVQGLPFGQGARHGLVKRISFESAPVLGRNTLIGTVGVLDLVQEAASDRAQVVQARLRAPARVRACRSPSLDDASLPVRWQRVQPTQIGKR
jgi:hypothetical protein